MPLGIFALSSPAFAQRAEDNAYNSAQDAFGTLVGSEGVGLYDSHNARGFDPTQAGNIRFEGLYFDQQAVFGSRLTRAQTIHVGIAAQSYPFPAPTGISDTTLVMPADKTIISTSLQYQDVGGSNQESLELSTPVTDTLGLVTDATYSPIVSEWGAPNTIGSLAALMRWRPSDKLEVIPLAYYAQYLNNPVQPLIFPAGAFLPPEYHRRTFFGQDWARRGSHDLSLGVIMRGSPFPNWRAEMAVFRSDGKHPYSYSIFYRNTQPNGSANLDILGFPASRATSISGEARLSGVYTEGSFRHTIHFDVRGRDVERLFNGASTISFGTAVIGVPQPVTQPVYTFGPRDKDVVRQITPGLSYMVQWARIGEFSVGAQKSFYHRDFGRESTVPITTKSQPWLYNATASVTPTDKLAFYASYTRGLEEFGTAPDNAANRGQPMPAALTKQVDAGLRYRIMSGLSLVAGVFEVSKPYFDRDLANIYTSVGDRSHKGIEMSLTGQVIPGLTIVAGAVLIKARVTGSSVTSGAIGNIPPGLSPSVYTLALQYAPANWHGVSIDTQFKRTAAQYANRADTLRLPTTFSLDAGFRYNFRVHEVDASFRAQVFNITNEYAWKTDAASGSIAPTPPRRYNVRLVADF